MFEKSKVFLKKNKKEVIISASSVAMLLVVIIASALIINRPIIAPNNWRPAAQLSAAIAGFSDAEGEADTDKAFAVGSSIFFNGDEELSLKMDFPYDAKAVNVKIDGEPAVTGITPLAGTLPLKFGAGKSHKVAFQLVDQGDGVGEWSEYDVHDVSAFTEHNGTIINLETDFDLQLLSARVNFGLDDYSGKTVNLVKSIALPSFVNNHMQIGNNIGGNTHSTFRGTFDGKNNAITGLNIKRTAKGNDSFAVFNRLDGILKNLTIKGKIDINAEGQSGEAGAFGFASSLNGAVVLNCTSAVDITVTKTAGSGVTARAAGLFGVITGDSMLLNCLNSGTVQSANKASGLIGELLSDTFTAISCGNMGNLKGEEVTAFAVINADNITEKKISVYNFFASGKQEASISNSIASVATAAGEGSTGDIKIAGGYSAAVMSGTGTTSVISSDEVGGRYNITIESYFAIQPISLAEVIEAINEICEQLRDEFPEIAEEIKDFAVIDDFNDGNPVFINDQILDSATEDSDKPAVLVLDEGAGYLRYMMGESFVLPNTPLYQKPLHEFVGWSVNRSIVPLDAIMLSSSELAAFSVLCGASISAEAAEGKVFCAVWIPEKRTVTFVNNGAGQSIRVYLGTMPTPPSVTRSSDYNYVYTFKGWNTFPQDDNDWNEDTAELQIVDDDITYYAIYQRTAIFRITFSPSDDDGLASVTRLNGTGAEFEEVALLDGETYTVNIAAFSNVFDKITGRTVDGIAITGESTVYHTGDTITVTDNIEFVFVFNPECHRVTIAYNNGSENDVFVGPGATVAVQAFAPPPYYKLWGYSKDNYKGNNPGSVPGLFPIPFSSLNGSLVGEGDITYYAIWISTIVIVYVGDEVPTQDRVDYMSEYQFKTSTEDLLGWTLDGYQEFIMCGSIAINDGLLGFADETDGEYFITLTAVLLDDTNSVFLSVNPNGKDVVIPTFIFEVSQNLSYTDISKLCSLISLLCGETLKGLAMTENDALTGSTFATYTLSNVSGFESVLWAVWDN